MLLKLAYEVGYRRALQDSQVKLAIDDDGTPPLRPHHQGLGAEQLAEALNSMADSEASGTTLPVRVNQLEPEESPASNFQFSKGRNIAAEPLTNLGIDIRPATDTGAL